MHSVSVSAEVLYGLTSHDTCRRNLKVWCVFFNSLDWVMRPSKHNKPFNLSLYRENANLLLTEREGRTGEYWPEVVTVRTERSEVRTKTTERQYSRVRPEQARLVSSLLYGTLFLIVKCTSGGLHLKNVRLLHPSLKFRKKFNLFSFCW